MRIPGPQGSRHNYQDIKDGTRARASSPRPGPLRINPFLFWNPNRPSVFDNLGGAGNPLNPIGRHFNEKYFEKRFPKDIKAAHLHIANMVFNWWKDPGNKFKTMFDDKEKLEREKTRSSWLAGARIATKT